MIILFLLKTALLLVALFFLMGYTAERMRIRFPAGSIPVLTLILPLLMAVPYVGWLFAALFLLRFTSVMSSADFWPDAIALALVIIPLLCLMKFILF